MAKINSRRVDAFDGLRGIAIILVLVGHSAGSYVPVAEASAMPWLHHIADNGAFGVGLFFVLSGYLITSLLIKERHQTGKVSLGRFYTRRFLRILPAFSVYLLTVGLLTAMQALYILPVEFAAAGTFTWNYRLLWLASPTTDGSWFLGHMWTLSLEEQFYIVWPFLFLLCSQSRLLAISLIAIPAFPIVRTVSYFWFPEQRGSLGMMFHTAADSIFIGCAFALLRDYRQHFEGLVGTPQPRDAASRREIGSKLRAVLGRWLPPAAPRSIVPWASVIVFVLLISPILRAELRGGYVITMGFTLEALCAALIVSWLHSGTSALALHSFLGSAALAWLGRLSYSLYLWQQLFLTPLNGTWTGRFPICILAAIAVACVSYYCIEMPVLKLKNRFASVSLGDSEKSAALVRFAEDERADVSPSVLS